MYMSCMEIDDRDNALTLLLALEQDQVCAVVIGVTLAQVFRMCDSSWLGPIPRNIYMKTQ